MGISKKCQRVIRNWFDTTQFGGMLFEHISCPCVRDLCHDFQRAFMAINIVNVSPTLFFLSSCFINQSCQLAHPSPLAHLIELPSGFGKILFLYLSLRLCFLRIHWKPFQLFDRLPLTLSQFSRIPIPCTSHGVLPRVFPKRTLDCLG